jgi:CDP-diacylglycerol--glycerol-3-phosphate 3-phosphatidyltransferase
MFRHVPNLLTGLRLVLAMVFFCMLAYYQYEGRGDPSFLWIAFIVYLVALITDFLDGFLARRWKVEGAFGRIVDPFVDKILVLGSFTFFAGKNFGAQFSGKLKMVVQSVTILVILVYVNYYQQFQKHGYEQYAANVRDFCIWATVAITVLSGILYIQRAIALYREHNATTAGAA